MTPIADMVAQMLADGTPHDSIVLAVATVERCSRPQMSMDTSADTVLALKRQADRERKKIERIQAKTGKQTMSGSDETVHGLSMDKGLPRCDLLPSSLSESVVPKSKKVVVERGAGARGTRLCEGSKLSTENRYFAAAAGIPEVEIDRVWAEFVDYWIAVPGQRGTKTKWDATWRNRVRQVTPWKGQGNGSGPRGGRPNSPASDFFAGLAQVAADIGGDGDVAGPADQDVPRGRVEIDH